MRTLHYRCDMNFVELVFIAIALSMDAFAVSIACGISAPKIANKNATIVAGAFGLFQAIMPLAGWNLSEFAYEYIKAFDHWIAFLMLALVGGKMVFDGFSNKEEIDKCFAYPKLDYRVLFLLAVATSLDALAIGVSFSCAKYPILYPSIFIGLTTFAFSMCGIKFGKRIGSSHDGKFAIAGGIVLILIGIKILITG